MESFASPPASRRPWRDRLPHGGVLDRATWERHHRFITKVLWLHVPALFLCAVATGRHPLHALADVAPVGLCAVGAGQRHVRRSLRSGAASLGLFIAAAVLVHLSDGLTEAHFYFFVVVGLVSLYQDWVPFLVGITFTLAEHSIVGMVSPEAVYSHAAAIEEPFTWSLIHAGFLLAAALPSMSVWRLHEDTALRDALTGLDNRALLLRRLERALARHRREQAPLTVLLMDLDGFKAVNDRRGHAAGDQVLVEVAERVRAAVRKSDTVARLGGDEFAIILDDADADTGTAIGRRLIASLLEPVTAAGSAVRVGASIGVACAGPSASTADELLRNADLAMYMAKAQGRSRLCNFEAQMRDEAQSRAELEAELGPAIAAGHLVLHYQPTVSLESGRIVGVEALVRWQHPERGLLQPDEFVPLAEQSDLICDVGRWVLGEATRQAKAWEEHFGLQRFRMAVNISARHLASEAFVADVTSALRAAALDPTALVIEITESILVKDVAASVGKLAELRRLGVRIAVDDFGTGFSSLSYLRHLPVDILKIDRSFVAGLDPAHSQDSLARAIVRIGETLALQVVAEGVEREDERAALRQLRCQQGQGFLFGRALPARQLATLLAPGPGLGSAGGDGPGRMLDAGATGGALSLGLAS